MSEKIPLPNLPDDTSTGEAAATNADLIRVAQAARAIAEAKATEANAAQAVAEAIAAEAQVAAKVAEKKEIAAGLLTLALPTPITEVLESPTVEAEASIEDEATTSADESAEKGAINKLLSTFWDSMLPQPNYAPEEKIKQIIYMAPYRATIPKLLAFLGTVLLLISIGGFVYTTWISSVTSETSAALATQLSNMQLVMGVALITALLAFIQALRTGLAYKQWQFIMTDMRTIITTPDPDQGLFADSIYLKDGTIKVLDTNFSKNAMWIPFQIFTGARDVMLSNGAYAFMENGAKVKDGIRFPDVTAEDIKHLEALVFSGKK